MNQKVSKPLSDFTDKQAETFKLAMKALAQKPRTRVQLRCLIERSGIYRTQRDCREVTKMLVKNPRTPISLNSEDKLENLIEAGKYEY